jgi:hypothetical protein
MKSTYSLYDLSIWKSSMWTSYGLHMEGDWSGWGLGMDWGWTGPGVDGLQVDSNRTPCL